MKRKVRVAISVIISIMLVIGSISVLGSQTEGADVSSGVSWTSFSVHGNNAEDNGYWEQALIHDGQVWCVNADREAVLAANGKLDAYFTYGEYASFRSMSDDNYILDVTSTGWSAWYNPGTGAVMQSNPWGVTTTKVVPVERGRHYTISFEIKSTLQNEITKCDDTTVIEGLKNWRGQDCHYTEGTGKYNYVKHFHFKAYDNNDDDGTPIEFEDITATYLGNNVLTNSTDYDNLIAMDSRNTDYVVVQANVLVPFNFQSGNASPTMGIKMAFGALLKEFKAENNMSGEIEVKDFHVIAGEKESTTKPTTIVPTSKQTPTTGKPPVVPTNKQNPTTKKTIIPAKNTILKIKQIKAGKKSLKIKWTRVYGAFGYKIQYSTKKNFKKKKTIFIINGNTTSKTIKKLKKKKKYYVRMCSYRTIDGTTFTSSWTKKMSKKTK